MISKGCLLCREGAKMVLFVTGICNRTCWYCPLSAKRKGKDVVYANDREVFSDEDVIEEAEQMGALGTGVTGGDPLLVMDRTVHYLRLLKDYFGPEHHVHLYTGIAPDRDQLERLRGLVDEIRLHPPYEIWESVTESEYIKAVKLARELGFDVGFEVPSLPGIQVLESALPYLDFLNINELEWGESCASEMRRRGFSTDDAGHNAVSGAREWAEELCTHRKVHFCSSTYKDSVQLRERLKRIAARTMRQFDEVTDDGTVIYAEYRPDRDIANVTANIEEGLYALGKDYIETAWWLVEDLIERFGGSANIIERYPNKGMIVEVMPV